jgi:tetratricopeptide (TPR) repeat protein
VDDPAAVGKRLKDAREAAGLSQRQLSFQGCSPAYVSRIEAGQRIPSLQLLRELGKRVGVSADYLATGADVGPDGGLPAGLLDAEVALRLDDVDAAAEGYAGFVGPEHDAVVRSRAYEGLGHVAVRRGEPGRAVELFRNALAAGGDDEADRPSLADGLARSYAQLGQLAESIAVLERCLDRYENDPVQYVRFAGLLGAALTDNGSFPEAELVLSKALARGRDVRDPYTRARLYWSEARLRSEQGQHELAARYHRHALETLHATEDTYAIARSHHALAHVYLNLGRPEDALDQLREGRPLIEQSATPAELAQYQLEEARALAAVGESEEGAALAMNVGAKLSGLHPKDSARVYALLGDVYASLGDSARAREVLELAVEELEQQGPSRYLVNAYKQLAAIAKDDDRPDEALALLERALGVQEQAGRSLS